MVSREKAQLFLIISYYESLYNKYILIFHNNKTLQAGYIAQFTSVAPGSWGSWQKRPTSQSTLGINAVLGYPQTVLPSRRVTPFAAGKALEGHEAHMTCFDQACRTQKSFPAISSSKLLWHTFCGTATCHSTPVENGSSVCCYLTDHGRKTSRPSWSHPDIPACPAAGDGCWCQSGQGQRSRHQKCLGDALEDRQAVVMLFPLVLLIRWWTLQNPNWQLNPPSWQYCCILLEVPQKAV